MLVILGGMPSQFNVVTDCLVFEGDGQVNSYVGGYDDWLRQSQKQEDKPAAAIVKKEKPKSQTKPAKKLSYNDQRELDELPKKIEALDAELEQIQQALSDPDLYQKDADKVTQLTARSEEAEAELAHCYQRWELLDGD